MVAQITPQDKTNPVVLNPQEALQTLLVDGRWHPVLLKPVGWYRAEMVARLWRKFANVDATHHIETIISSRGADDDPGERQYMLFVRKCPYCAGGVK